MSGIEIFQIWIIAFFTLALMSFLYKDNPVYKLAEHIFAGLSAGYYVGLIWDTVIVQQLWDPMFGGKWWLVFPGLLGMLMFARFFSKYAWVSRTPLAFVMAVTAGVFLVSQLHGLVLPQTQDTMSPKTEAVPVVMQDYDANANILYIVDTVAAAESPVTHGQLSLSKGEVDRRGGDSVVISATFEDPHHPALNRLAVNVRLRGPNDKTQKAVVVMGHSETPGVTIVDNGGGSYTASVVFRPDSTGTVGPYDVSFEVHRTDQMYFLTVIVLIGVISTLIYFYFSKEHTGALGVTAKVGIWFIMIAFGAHFGYTVMGRVSLLIGRVQFLMEDWLGSFSHLF